MDDAVSLQVKRIVIEALAEDIGTGDATTLWTIPSDKRSQGEFVAKAEGVIAGLEVAALAFTLLDPQIRLVPLVADGDWVEHGTIIARASGPAQMLLTGERTALNLLQRMSGIATETRRYVNAVAGTHAVILDTRKTAPGLRVLDKWAVRLGGGRNHRSGLYDMVLIKDNHIAAAGGITPAVRRVREAMARSPSGDMQIELEVASLAQLREALALPVDRIMLDNMSIADMREAVALTAGRVPLEASGGVDLSTVAEIAATGVDYISVGALTHSVRALDISLDLSE